MNAHLRLLWHIGGSQTDVAILTAEQVDWNDRTISFDRKKTSAPVVITFGADAVEILESLPKPVRCFHVWRSCMKNIGQNFLPNGWQR